MARIKYTHNSFSTGVVSKDIQGNVSFEGYANALDSCDNFLVHATGGLFKRAGTRFVSRTLNNGKSPSVLIHYSADKDSCMLELGVDHQGRGRIRVFAGPLPELAVDITEAELGEIRYFQQGRTMYFLREGGISSLSPTNDKKEPFRWRAVARFSVMPFTFMNKDPIVLRCAKTGGVDKIGEKGSEIIVSFANSMPGGGFLPDMVAPGFFDDEGDDVHGDRYVSLTFQVASTDESKFTSAEPIFFLKILRIERDPQDSRFNRAICVIDKYLSPKSNAEGDSWLPMYSDDKKTYCDVLLWRVSAFSARRGMPKACSIFEGRLFLANNAMNPFALWGSSTFYEDFFNFTLGPDSGDGLQARALGRAGEINWLAAHNKLFIGTKGGIFLAGSAGLTDEALTPKSFQGIHLFSNVGASDLQPVQALDAIFFVDNYGTGLHEIVLSEVGVFRVNDLSMLAKDVTRSGIVAHTWQQNPLKTYWAVLGDGRLAALTYLKNNNIVAWGHHTIGGPEAKVMSIASISIKHSDRVWLIVERKIGDQYIRTVEYIVDELEETMDSSEAHVTDGGVYSSQPYPIVNFHASVEPTITYAGAPVINVTLPAKSFFMCYTLGGNAMTVERSPEFLSVTGSTWRHSGMPAGLPIDRLSYVTANTTYANTLMLLYAGEIVDSAIDGSIRIELAPYITPAVFQTAKDCGFLGSNLVYTAGGVDHDINVKDAVGPGPNFHSIVASGTAGYYTVSTDGGGPALALGSGDGQVARGMVFVVYSEATLTSGVGASIDIRARQAPAPNVYLYLDGFAGAVQLNKQTYAAWNTTELGENLYRCFLGTEHVISGTHVLLPLDSAGVDPYTAVGGNPWVYVIFNEITMPDHFIGQRVACFLNGGAVWYGTVGADSRLVLPYPCFSASVGFSIKGHFKTTPFYGGSMLGSSEGSVCNQRAATFRLYRSLGGRYGADLETTYPIPYRQAAPIAFDVPRDLETTQIRVPMSGLKSGTYMDMTFSMVHDDPTPFAVLNVTREIEVSDA